MTVTEYAILPSPVGDLLLTAEAEGLTGLLMAPFEVSESWERDEERFAFVGAQLDAYWSGTRQSFDVPVDLRGSAFQLRVWQALTEIPYGTTISYGELARRAGKGRAARAAGAACGRNPVSIIVPCHRVVGASGVLTGYGGGIDRKRALLELEGRGAPNGAAPRAAATRRA